MGREWEKTSGYVLTEGGLVRSLRVGHPEHTMHLRWNGESGDVFVEMELLRIEGDTVVLRLWAPDQVRIVSAKKDPHCQAVPR